MNNCIICKQPVYGYSWWTKNPRIYKDAQPLHEGECWSKYYDINKDLPPYKMVQHPLDGIDPMENIKEFETGAVRSNSDEGFSFDSISPIGLMRLAKRCYLGEVIRRYGKGNWLKGLPYRSIVNHIEKHWHDWKLNGCENDDNLAAIAWGVFVLMHYEDTGRTELNDLPWKKNFSEKEQELKSKLIAVEKQKRIFEEIEQKRKLIEKEIEQKIKEEMEHEEKHVPLKRSKPFPYGDLINED